ncbi:MAG TPA: response regulator [Candidatus Angelobacter sp.]|nr:response regulator [Candidatus Angelobacter sp.]
MNEGPENWFLEQPRGRETILFVEDEEPLRTVVGDFLSQLGYRVLSASNGKDALSVAAACPDPIDLLLTDVRMPEMSGPELAQSIQPTRPTMKVIYISGFAEPILAPYGVLKAGTILLQKPFSIKVLSTKLREVLEDRHSQGKGQS